MKKIVRILFAAGSLVSLLSPPALALAQQPANPPMIVDTPPPMRPGMRRPGMMGQGRMMDDTARAQMLRERVEQRFGQMVQQELQLTEPQMQQLRVAVRAHTERRRELAQRQQAVNQAIRWQMRPGIAADRDSLDRLESTRTHLRVEQAQQEEQLERELGFLTTVQRVRFMQMMRTFEQRIQEIRMRQMRQMQGMGQEPGPFGPRPMRRP
ncbi:MAG: hypothetical protein ACHQU1_07545 [Gemmatimonadales bacterium]